MFKRIEKYTNLNFATYLLIFLFFLIYLFFPTLNSSIDAYNYAANVKWNNDLFFPHHLLYNFLPFYMIQFAGSFGYQIDALALMKFFNGVFGALSLLVFYRILIYYKADKTNHFALVLMAGSSFGFMRFATENETYIIPIFWSLLSTLYFLKYLKSDSSKAVLWSGIFAVISCLFHQIHILWYAGLLIGIIFYRTDIKNALILIAPAILLQVVYYFAFKQVHYEFDKAQNLWQFILYDYYYGTAHVQFGMDNFILGFISFIRSFVQVHGTMFFLLKKNYWYLLAIAPLLFSIFQFIKYLWINKSEKSSTDVFVKILILIFSLQFAFAIFSNGNTEFMVMLPLLLLLIINGLYKIKSFNYLNLGIAILVWNLVFGLIPNHFYNFQNQEKMIRLIDNKNDALYILSEDVLVQNILYYKTGSSWNSNIYKSPATLKQQNKTDKYLREKIDSCFSNNILIITDCIDEPEVMSRKQYLNGTENEKFFKDFTSIKIDSVQTLIGTKYISMLRK